MGLKEFAAEYSEKTGFPIFVGIEFYSLQGDIVAFGIENYPKERIPAQEFVDLVQAQGGMCFSAHPFRNNNRGLEENPVSYTHLDVYKRQAEDLFLSVLRSEATETPKRIKTVRERRIYR